MARVSRAILSVYVPSVVNRFIFGQGVVIYFIMQLLLKKLTKTQSLFHINRATVLTYDLAGAACRRHIADNFSNIQTGRLCRRHRTAAVRRSDGYLAGRAMSAT